VYEKYEVGQATDTHNKTISEMMAKRISRYRKRTAGNRNFVFCMRYKQSRKHNEAISTKLNKTINLHKPVQRKDRVSYGVQNLHTKTKRTSEQYS
jgi:DUF917 family protein